MKKDNTLSWILEVKKEGKDKYIEFPTGLLEQVGWKIGDTILFEEARDGYVLTKIEKQ